jgi:hypothetical protein
VTTARGRIKSRGVTTVADDSYSQPTNATPTPNPDLRSLDKLVGTWGVSGPSISGQITYEWMEGGFFLIQRVDLVHDGRKIKGIEIIGHEQPFGGGPSEEIKSRYYDTMGETLDYQYEIEGDTLTIWGGQKGSPAYYRGTFSGDGDIVTGGWVYPGGGYESNMYRIKP